jgi:1-pyrroline-5-carboxylate dehydrogenase
LKPDYRKVFKLCPRSGAEVGDIIVGHKLTRGIAFTGSVGVGCHINELAAKVQEGQIWLKRVIAEMGGKDSIIVDSEADVDDAVNGVIASAFGFQGQNVLLALVQLLINRFIRNLLKIEKRC